MNRSALAVSNSSFDNVAEPNVVENVQGLELEAVRRNEALLTEGI